MVDVVSERRTLVLGELNEIAILVRPFVAAWAR